MSKNSVEGDKGWDKRSDKGSDNGWGEWGGWGGWGKGKGKGKGGCGVKYEVRNKIRSDGIKYLKDILPLLVGPDSLKVKNQSTFFIIPFLGLFL